MDQVFNIDSAIASGHPRDIHVALQQNLGESISDFIDPRAPYNDTPGFGWLSRRLAFFSNRWDRADGRFVPVYENEMDLRAIRYASWLMDAEVPVAKAMKARLCDYTISSGFDWAVTHPSPRVERICKRIVETFMDNCDWNTIEKESFEREIVDGEFLAEIVCEDGEIGLEVIEGDHLTEPVNPSELSRWKEYDFPESWSFGVLTKKNRHKPIAYHIVRDEGGTDWDLVDESNVIHWKRNVPKNAKRGVSDHYTTHKCLRYAERVLTNTAQGTAIQAAIAYIVEHTAGTNASQAAAIAANRHNVVVKRDPITGNSTNTRTVKPGQVIDIPNGAKYHSSLLGSNASNIYIEVMESLFRISGTIHAFPEHMLTGFAGNNNMASSIEAKTPFVQGRFADMRVRTQRLKGLLRKVIQFALNKMPSLGISYEEIAAQLDITAAPPNIIGKAPDELIESLIKQHEKGWISERQAIQQLGGDYEDVKAEIKAEKERAIADGDTPIAGDGQQPEQVGPDGLPIAPTASPDASMAGLSRRQFTNNKKAIRDVMAELERGEITNAQARVMLSALGLAAYSIKELLGAPLEAPVPESIQENCGNGGGGFKPGNKCQKGGGKGAAGGTTKKKVAVKAQYKTRDGKPITMDDIDGAIHSSSAAKLHAMLRNTAPESLKSIRGAIQDTARQTLSDYDWTRLLLASGVSLDGHIINEKPKAKPITKATKAQMADKAEAWSSKVQKSNKSTVNFSLQAKEVYEKLAGKKVNPATLVGMPHGSEVDVNRMSSGSVNIQGFHDDIRVSRVLTRDKSGNLIMHNAEIEVNENRPGLGRQALRNQIAAARAIGVTKITATATGPTDDSYERSNGYYTWARYGYSAPIAKMNPELKAKVQAAFPTAKDVLDVMATPKGRDWWRDNGDGMSMTFDLDPKSRSMQTFTAYMTAKGEV